MHHLSYPGIPLESSTREDAFISIRPCAIPDQGNYYFLSNDVLHDRTRWLTRSDDVAFIGVANPHWFHALSLTTGLRDAKPKRLVAFDSNPQQLRHFVRIRDLILQCEDRIRYLERLFSVHFGAGARHALEHFECRQRRGVHGAVRRDPYIELERSLWRDCEFDTKAFESETGLDAAPLTAGLHIRSETVGDVDDYVATFLCGSRAAYTWCPFTAAFGSGFLANEDCFQALRERLADTPTYPILIDAAEDLDSLLLAHRYQPIWLWMSDLLCNYFVQQHPPFEQTRDAIRARGRARMPHAELDIWLHQDRRSASWFDWRINDWGVHHRPWSIHTESFHRVAKQLRGSSGLEVVAVKRWIDQDEGDSKLPNTRYCPLEAFASDHYDAPHSTIFLHILLGHGVGAEAFHAVVAKARRLSPNVVILEHNPDSKDFATHDVGLNISTLTQRHGLPCEVDFAPGPHGPDRNWIAVYRDA